MERNTQRLHNNLDWEEDFRKGEEDEFSNSPKNENNFKNKILAFTLIVLSLTFMNDFDFIRTANQLISVADKLTKTTQVEEGNDIIETSNSEISVSSVDLIIDSELGSFEDYLMNLQEAGVYYDFAAWERKAVFDGNISIEYLKELKSIGALDKLFGYEIVNLTKAGITTEKLEKWIKSGYVDKLQDYEIIAFENSGIDFDSIIEYDKKGWLGKYEPYEIEMMVNGYTSGL